MRSIIVENIEKLKEKIPSGVDTIGEFNISIWHIYSIKKYCITKVYNDNNLDEYQQILRINDQDLNDVKIQEIKIKLSN